MTSGSLGPSRFDEAATPARKAPGSTPGEAPRRAETLRDILAGIALGAAFLVALMLLGRAVCP